MHSINGKAMVRYARGISQYVDATNAMTTTHIITDSFEIRTLFRTSHFLMYTGTNTIDMIIYAKAKDAAKPTEPHFTIK